MSSPDYLADMSEEIVNEIVLFAKCVSCGVVFGLIYDCFRVYRKIKKHNRIMIDLEDLLYWIICFWISFCLLYYANNIVIRFFCVMAAAIGMWLYNKTIGKVYVKVIFRVCEIIYIPIRLIKNKLTKMMKQITIILRRRAKEESNLVLEEKEKAQI